MSPKNLILFLITFAAGALFVAALNLPWYGAIGGTWLALVVAMKVYLDV